MSRRNTLVFDLAANLAWPWVVLTWASGEDLLGPRWGPAVAMLGPLAHAVWRRVAQGRTSALSVLVIVSIGLNAAAGFLPLAATWFAVKEALLPAGFGLVFAATAARGPGLLAELVGELLDGGKVAAAVAERGSGDEYLRGLRRGTVGFGLVFAASGVVSGGLAWWMVRSPTGSAGFAGELGSYTLWSYGLVNLPTLLATAWLMRGLLLTVERATGRELEELYPG